MTGRAGGAADRAPAGTSGHGHQLLLTPDARPAPRRPVRHAARRLLPAAALCGATTVLFACYLRISATFPAGSDGASNALEAWNLLHGNWLLHGWTLTDVSFWPTELLEYAAVELARGLNPGVVHTAAALTYTLLLAAAGALASGRPQDWGGSREGWTRTLIATGIMLAPQLGNAVHVLLSQPDHVGTQVPLLGIFLLLDRAPRRWHTLASVWTLLVVTIVADKVTILDAAVPLTVAGMLHAIRTAAPRRERGTGEQADRPHRFHVIWFLVSLAAAALAAAGMALSLLALIRRLGGFTLLPVNTRIVPPGGVPAHLPLAWHGVLTLFGADVMSAPPGPQTVMACLHVPGLAIAAAALAIGIWRLPRRDDLVNDVLVVAIIVNLAAFVASGIPATPFDTREMAAVLPFGAVLAGRIFGPRFAGSEAGRPSRPGLPTRLPRVRPTLVALAACGVCQLIALGYGATRPPATAAEQALADWLAARHLTTGLGTYTEDNITTLDSGGRVRLLTVCWRYPGRSPASSGGTVPRLYQSSASWYDPRTTRANFVVTGTADGTADLIPRAEILGLAGAPDRTYQVGPFTVMVWNENLLTRLGRPPAHTPGDIGHS